MVKIFDKINKIKISNLQKFVEICIMLTVFYMFLEIVLTFSILNHYEVYGILGKEPPALGVRWLYVTNDRILSPRYRLGYPTVLIVIEIIFLFIFKKMIILNKRILNHSG